MPGSVQIWPANRHGKHAVQQAWPTRRELEGVEFLVEIDRVIRQIISQE
jgi:hypothetical protein